MRDLSRLRRHLFARPASKVFPADALARIGRHIHETEQTHRGEIVFAVESDLPPKAIWAGVDARRQAQVVFAQLNVWNTRENNGVLIYLLLADRRIEIIADRGLDGHVSAEQWRGVCQLMEERMAAGEPEAALHRGIDATAALLSQVFPGVPEAGHMDELPDAPVILR